MRRGWCGEANARREGAPSRVFDGWEKRKNQQSRTRLWLDAARVRSSGSVGREGERQHASKRSRPPSRLPTSHTARLQPRLPPTRLLPPPRRRCVHHRPVCRVRRLWRGGRVRRPPPRPAVHPRRGRHPRQPAGRRRARRQWGRAWGRAARRRAPRVPAARAAAADSALCFILSTAALVDPPRRAAAARLHRPQRPAGGRPGVVLGRGGWNADR